MSGYMPDDQLDDLLRLLDIFKERYTERRGSRWEHYNNSVAVVENIVATVRNYGHELPGTSTRKAEASDTVRPSTGSEQAKTPGSISTVSIGRWEIP